MTGVAALVGDEGLGRGIQEPGRTRFRLRFSDPLSWCLEMYFPQTSEMANLRVGRSCDRAQPTSPRMVAATFLARFWCTSPDQERVLVVDQAGDFAPCATRLLKDSTFARHLGEMGQKRAESSYAWASAARQPDELHERVLANPLVGVLINVSDEGSPGAS